MTGVRGDASLGEPTVAMALPTARHPLTFAQVGGITTEPVCLAELRGVRRFENAVFCL